MTYNESYIQKNITYYIDNYAYFEFSTIFQENFKTYCLQCNENYALNLNFECNSCSEIEFCSNCIYMNESTQYEYNNIFDL